VTSHSVNQSTKRNWLTVIWLAILQVSVVALSHRVIRPDCGEVVNIKRLILLYKITPATNAQSASSWLMCCIEKLDAWMTQIWLRPLDWIMYRLLEWNALLSVYTSFILLRLCSVFAVMIVRFTLSLEVPDVILAWLFRLAGPSRLPLCWAWQVGTSSCCGCLTYIY